MATKILTTLRSFRDWRQLARSNNLSVGFVPTMGALHQGHLSLVRRSLAENDLTVLSIFVNPAQFAPHEDLATYPRTLERDLDLIAAQSVQHGGATRSPAALFLPSVAEMYPSGINQVVADQKGTFVDVTGFSHQMEGTSRPTFFRGVATVATKLFNAVEPTNAYFGQKDIQQALILRRLAKDLLLSHPDPAHLHIVPIARDPTDGLALSSRNAYLSPQERAFAPTLRLALLAAEHAWQNGAPKEDCLKTALDIVDAKKSEIARQNLDVDLRLDYIQINDSHSFDVLDPRSSIRTHPDPPKILSGAMWVGKTRLIDNIILGNASEILS